MTCITRYSGLTLFDFCVSHTKKKKKEKERERNRLKVNDNQNTSWDDPHNLAFSVNKNANVQNKSHLNN